MATETATAPAPVEAPPATPPGPSTEQLTAALDLERQLKEQERQRAAQLEQEVIRARQSEQHAWTARQQESQPPPESSYKKVFEDALVNPDAAAVNLQRLVEQAADKKADERARQLAQAMAAQQQQNNVAMSFNSFAARNPDLASPENQPRLAGAVVQVDMENRRKGLILPQDQLLEQAARSLRQSNPRPAQPPAYVEGGSSPALAPGLGTPQPQVPTQNVLEKRYGMDPGQIVDLPEGPDDWERLATEYVNQENAAKIAHGIPLPNLRVKG